jgi:MFS family permease
VTALVGSAVVETGGGGQAAGRLGARFATLWAASTTSALGSRLATVAAPLLVASRTSDPLVVSAAFGVARLPWLLFSLPGGVLVDRVDRRRLMVVVDWVRVAAMAALATAVLAGHAGIALLYAVLFVVDTGEVVLRPASQAMVPAVVPRDRLERANGWLVGGTTLMQGMLAGPLGGFLFAVAAPIPFFANAGTYAASAVLLALVPGTYRAAADARPPADGGGGGARRRSVRAEVAEGFRWLAGQRLLRTMATLIGLLNLTLTAATAVLVLLAGERLHLGSVGYGLLFTCMAAGGLLGSVVGDRLVAQVTASGRSSLVTLHHRRDRTPTLRGPSSAATSPSASASEGSPGAAAASRTKARTARARPTSRSTTQRPSAGRHGQVEQAPQLTHGQEPGEAGAGLHTPEPRSREGTKHALPASDRTFPPSIPPSPRPVTGATGGRRGAGRGPGRRPGRRVPPRCPPPGAVQGRGRACAPRRRAPAPAPRAGRAGRPGVPPARLPCAHPLRRTLQAGGPGG